MAPSRRGPATMNNRLRSIAGGLLPIHLGFSSRLFSGSNVSFTAAQYRLLEVHAHKYWSCLNAAWRPADRKNRRWGWPSRINFHHEALGRNYLGKLLSVISHLIQNHRFLFWAALLTRSGWLFFQSILVLLDQTHIWQILTKLQVFSVQLCTRQILQRPACPHWWRWPVSYLQYLQCWSPSFSSIRLSQQPGLSLEVLGQSSIQASYGVS